MNVYDAESIKFWLDQVDVKWKIAYKMCRLNINLNYLLLWLLVLSVEILIGSITLGYVNIFLLSCSMDFPRNEILLFMVFFIEATWAALDFFLQSYDINTKSRVLQSVYLRLYWAGASSLWWPRKFTNVSCASRACLCRGLRCGGRGKEAGRGRMGGGKTWEQVGREQMVGLGPGRSAGSHPILWVAQSCLQRWHRI